MSSKSQISIQNAVYLFAQMQSNERKRLLPATRKFMKSQEVRKFTPEIVEGQKLRKCIKKDIRSVVTSVTERVEDLQLLFERAVETMDVRRLRRCVDCVVYLGETLYFEYKIFKIIVMGFYQMNPQMMARYKCLNFISAADTVFNLGISLWKLLQTNRDEPGIDALIARFERKADGLGALLCQHCRGRADESKPWWSISLGSSAEYYAVWRDLEHAIHGEYSVRESLSALQHSTTPATPGSGQSHSAPTSPVARPRRVIHKRNNDSFDSFLNGHAF